MPHIEILTDDLNADAHFVNAGVRLAMSPDALEMPKVDEYVDLVAGYEVMSVRQTQHDGVPATLITLGDSTGNREVGILRVRNDAVREAQLEVTRLFEDSEALGAWVAAQTARPDGLPDGYEKVEARTVMVGDSIWVESDPDDNDLEDGTVTVSKVEVFVGHEGKAWVSLYRDESTASTFLPGEWSDHAPDGQVWVKRA